MQALGTHGPALTASGSGAQDCGGNNHHNDFLRHFGHVYSLSICSDDMPDLANQVVLSETNIADDGLPAARMIYKTQFPQKSTENGHEDGQKACFRRAVMKLLIALHCPKLVFT